MTTDTYTLSQVTLRGLTAYLARRIETATLALVRIDEQLARSEPALADGVRARFHLFEAQALAQMAGELASLEDLVPHDAGMDVRAPSTGLVRASLGPGNGPQSSSPILRRQLQPSPPAKSSRNAPSA